MKSFSHILGFTKSRAKEILVRILLDLFSSVEEINDILIAGDLELFVCLKELEEQFSIPRTEITILRTEKFMRKFEREL